VATADLAGDDKLLLLSRAPAGFDWSCWDGARLPAAALSARGGRAVARGDGDSASLERLPPDVIDRSSD
jgi:hypothetical protein